jgi:hypothetical protein
MATVASPRRAFRRYSRHAKPCPAGGKKGFTTKRKARVVAEQLEVMDDVTMYVYRCVNCPHWHLTREEPRSTR